MSAKTISWAANEYGYVVQWCDQRGQVIDQYNAGNSKYESSTYVEPGSDGAESEETLRKFAKQTALEKAAELGISPENVSEDSDLADELRETYRLHGPEGDDDSAED